MKSISQNEMVTCGFCTNNALERRKRESANGFTERFRPYGIAHIMAMGLPPILGRGDG